MNNTHYAIEFINATKKFGEFYANDNINIKIKHNTIHAIIGENGAGKSTLMSSLFGIYTLDSGVIKIYGVNSFINNPNEAGELGIGMVHQHFKLVGDYTNLENIILGNEIHNKGFIDFQTAKTKIEILQDKYSLHFDLNQKTADANVATQQKIEILKVLYRDAEILIFDEPTAVLNPQEIEAFLQILKVFVQNGKTIIFISHKLNEVKSVADSATVLRHGKVVTTFDSLENIEIEDLSTAMVGQKVVMAKNNQDNNFSQIGLSLENISAKHHKEISNISFDIYKGEILAIAGIEGNGQEELEFVINGIIKPNSGKIIAYDSDNQPIELTHLSVTKRKDLISYVPGDRHKYGIVLDMNNLDNSILRSLNSKEFIKHSYIKPQAVKSFYKKMVKEFDVRGDKQGIKNIRLLSGGNQQKAVVAREMLSPHEILVIIQPTRGLDIGAINLIHEAILQEKKQNKTILLISFELDEVLSLADSIIVMNKGQISKKFKRNEIDRNQIGLLMGGIYEQ
ncbi:ABC transporter ATP-binding protein [Mesomycoplasma conjunctivae]|uniref:ABC transporter ATP-binding protein n=1 Tax=Mesomycoplasma conjunctivae TaxID=45361 RepID=UPI003DA3C2E7